MLRKMRRLNSRMEELDSWEQQYRSVLMDLERATVVHEALPLRVKAVVDPSCPIGVQKTTKESENASCNLVRDTNDRDIPSARLSVEALRRASFRCGLLVIARKTLEADIASAPFPSPRPRLDG